MNTYYTTSTGTDFNYNWSATPISITGTGLQQDFSGLEKLIIKTSDSSIFTINCHMPYEIKQIKQHVPEKVYEFIFYDNQKVKTICAEEDDFNFDYACFLAIAKKLYSKTLTFDGILSKIQELTNTKQYIKIVKQAKKKFFEEKEKEQKTKEEEELRKRQHKKYVEKKIQRKQKKKQDLADTIKIALQDVYNTNK